MPLAFVVSTGKMNAVGNVLAGMFR
jgi:hypothetical protein